MVTRDKEAKEAPVVMETHRAAMELTAMTDHRHWAEPKAEEAGL